MSKRGINIYKRKDGRWEGRAFIAGTAKYKSVYGRTYSEAKDKLVKLKLNSESHIQPCKLLFSDILLDWLESCRSHVKSSTFSCYYTKVHKHIIPYFHDKKYSCVTAADITRFIERMSKNYSQKYLSDMLVLLKTAAKWAEKQYEYRNVISSVESIKVKQTEPQLLDKNQQKILQNYLFQSDSSCDAGILLAVFTGLRIGELCALTWENIDLKHGLLKVNKTIQRIQTIDEQEKTSVIISSPKTEKANRIVPIPPFILEHLKNFQCNENCYLISSTHKFMEPRCLSYRFKKILKSLDLPPIKFHVLRHTFATNCLQTENFDIKTLSEILGHANTETTMRTYVHSSLEQKIACMGLLQLIS